MIELLQPIDQLDAMRAEIHAFELEHAANQKEALAQSAELRTELQEVATLRGRDVATDYTDFEGMRSTMKAVFDFRTKADGSYGERWDAEENAKDFLAKCDEGRRAKIYELAELFGLTGDSEPTDPDVKAGVILGGGGPSPLDRTRYAKELIDNGTLKPQYLVALGSNRAVDADEIERAGAYAQGAATEFDLLKKATEQVFETTIDDEAITTWMDQAVDGNVPKEHRVAYIPETEDHPPIFIISSAVVTNPFMQVTVGGEKKTILRDRANTHDTFATFGKMAELEPGDKAVAITNAHFRPFQGAAAAGQLSRYGVMTEVVGFDPTHYDKPPKRTDELLQEMLTTADSLAKIDTTKLAEAKKSAASIAKVGSVAMKS